MIRSLLTTESLLTKDKDYVIVDVNKKEIATVSSQNHFRDEGLHLPKGSSVSFLPPEGGFAVTPFTLSFH